MSMTYTFGKGIPLAGVTGEIYNALHNNTTSAIAVTVTPVRNIDNDTVSLNIPPGGILPVKVRQVKPQTGSNNNIVGLS